ncbi:putative Ig domain-containing protein [Bdellovibrionota bacterium FG-1]
MIGACRPTVIALLLWALGGGLAGCSLAKNSVPLSSLADYRNLPVDAELSLFAVNSGLSESAYVGTLQRTTTGIELPAAALSDIQARSAAQPVAFVIKSFSVAAATGSDYFLETPILSSSLEFSGATTALWLAVKLSVKNAAKVLKIDRATWDDLLFVLENSCKNCKTMSTSEVWAVLRSNAELQTSLNLSLSQLNPPVQLLQTVLDSPPIQIAKSVPVSVNGIAVTQAIVEGSTLSFEAEFYAPDQASERIAPTSWSSSASGNTVFATNAATASKYFDFFTAGTDTITAGTNLTDGRSASVVFNQSVANVNQPPTWASIPTPSFIANHRNTLDLSLYGQDIDGDPMTFSLVSGPAGLTLNASTIEWNPTQAPNPDQLGTFEVIAKVRSTVFDASVTFHVAVTQDHLPSFALGIPSSWNLSEGTLGVFSFATQDTESDPLALSCVSGCAAIVSGSPADAGWPSSYSYGGVPGAQTISISYKPSYLETIGGDAARAIVLGLSYDQIADPNLRQITPVEFPLTLNITNTDDPPSWIAGGAILTEDHTGGAALTENVAFTSTTAFLAIDPAPGATALTYSVPALPTYCPWLTLNGSRKVTGTPGYASPATCVFQIRATDTHGLFSDSPNITYAITDVNRPPVTAIALPDQTIAEGQTLTLALATYFSDPDVTVGDPRETLVYSCTNCPAGATISGSTLTYIPAYSISTGAPVAFNGVQITVTDKGGATASQTFKITVTNALGPPVIAFSSGTLTLAANQVTQTETDAAGTIIVGVSFYAGDAPYAYDLSVSCSPSCSGSLVSLPVTSGSTAANYNLNITPSYTDGDGGTNASQKNYTVTISGAQNAGILTGSSSFVLNIENVNRLPTALVIAGDNGVGTYAFTIDGSTWNSHTTALSTADPDGTNDAYTYSFVTTTYAAVGSLSGSNWSFNPIQAGCASGSETVVKTFDLKTSDNRGGTVTRRLQMTVLNAQTGGGGSCPY